MSRLNLKQARRFARNNKRCANIVRLALQDIAKQHQERADIPVQPLRGREDYQTAIVDLLTNVRHFCDAKGIEFHEADDSAHRHYTAEVVQARTGGGAMSNPISGAGGTHERARAEQERYCLTTGDGVEITGDRCATIMRLLEAIHDIGGQNLCTDCEGYRNRARRMQNLLALWGDAPRGKPGTVAEIDQVLNGAFDGQEHTL